MNVSDLREILQYVPRFRERIFVIAVDGAVAASENFPNILLDLAVLRSLSVRVVLVHGAISGTSPWYLLKRKEAGTPASLVPLVRFERTAFWSATKRSNPLS